MSKLYYFIKRRWITIIAVFLALSVFIHGYVSRKQVLYEAEASIAFIGEEGSFIPEAEARGVKDRELLKKVSHDIQDISAEDLERGLSLEFKKENILSVSYLSPKPAVARDAVNAVCYLFLNERDNLIEKFNKEKRLRLNTISDEVRQLRSELNSAQRRIRELKAKNAEADIKSSDLQKRVAELDMQRSELLKIFTEKHPDVINVSDKIAMLQEDLRALPDNADLYSRMAATIDEKDAVLSDKLKLYNELESSYKDKGEPWHAKLAKEAELPVSPVGKNKKWFYLWGLSSVFLISIFAGIVIEASDRRIYTKQEAEKILGLPVIADIGKPPFSFKKLSLPANRSLINYWASAQFLRTYQHLFSSIDVDIFKGKIDKKAILITGTEDHIGKSFIASSLAYATAKNGRRVLLIDSNFRSPAVGKMFGLDNDSKGLSDILRGSANHREVVRNFTDLLLSGSLELDKKGIEGMDNLKILLSGTRVDNPLGLFGAKELSVLFRELTEAYGLLVIDAGSINRNPDVLSIVPSVDTVLMVINKFKTTYPRMKNSISRIAKIQGPLAGLIFCRGR